jgi:hypothetical protein
VEKERTVTTQLSYLLERIERETADLRNQLGWWMQQERKLISQPAKPAYAALLQLAESQLQLLETQCQRLAEANAPTLYGGMVVLALDHKVESVRFTLGIANNMLVMAT